MVCELAMKSISGSANSIQTGRAYPPRLITFQFSTTQGLALEFQENRGRA
jgi:hypothetical protein